MDSWEEWKKFFTPEERENFYEPEEEKRWVSFYTRHMSRNMLLFTRHLLENRDTFCDYIKDFIEKADDQTPGYYPYFPALVEVRQGITIDKYEEVRDTRQDIFGRCFCENQNSCPGCKMIPPEGITCDEGIEMFDNFIKLGAKLDVKFRKLGVDHVDKSTFDRYVRPKMS